MEWNQPLSLETEARKPSVAKVRYTHDAVIDEIIAEPSVSQGELSRRFGFTETWMSIIINSDAFQERLAERKAILVDPRLIATIEDRLGSLARGSLDKLLERLDSGATIRTSDLVSMAKLAVGDKNSRPAAPMQQNNLYVVALPPRETDSKTWLQNASGRKPPEVIDVPLKVTGGFTRVSIGDQDG